MSFRFFFYNRIIQQCIIATPLDVVRHMSENLKCVLWEFILKGLRHSVRRRDNHSEGYPSKSLLTHHALSLLAFTNTKWGEEHVAITVISFQLGLVQRCISFKISSANTQTYTDSLMYHDKKHTQSHTPTHT